MQHLEVRGAVQHIYIYIYIYIIRRLKVNKSVNVSVLLQCTFPLLTHCWVELPEFDVTFL